MSTTDFAALLVAISSIVAAVFLAVAALSIRAAVRSMRGSVSTLVDEALPVIEELRVAVDRANDELVKVDAVLDTADVIGNTVDSASKLAARAVSKPVIKTIAVAAGGRTAAQTAAQREALMLKRTFWFGTGVAAAVYVQRKVKRYAPEQLQQRVKAAVDEGVAAMKSKEEELKTRVPSRP